jgi:hypothetical protein
MRLWIRPNRLSRGADRSVWRRCILVLEPLEVRDVLSPIVWAPEYDTPPQTPEGISYQFGEDNIFYAYDSANQGQTYQANLTATNGTITVDPTTAADVNVTVQNNGTANVILTGELDKIDSVLDNGPTFAPTAYFCGDAIVGVTVTDLLNGGPPGSGTVDVQVTPVADMPAFFVPPVGEIPAPDSGFAFPPGFISIAPWPQISGTETVTVSFVLSTSSPDQFALSTEGTLLTPIEPGQWQVSATNPTALAAMLDSLVLIPPSGFSGPMILNVKPVVLDQVTYADGTTLSSGDALGSADISIRFYQGGSVTAPPAAGQENSTLDLGGLYSVSDPDVLAVDTLSLSLSVPQGALSYDSSAIPAGLTVSGGNTALTLTGSVADMNAFLAAAGGLSYTPDANFAGAVPLALVLTLTSGTASGGYATRGSLNGTVGAVGATYGPPPVVATSLLSIDPTVIPVFPTATSITTNENKPVALSIGLSAIPASESVAIVVDGVPTGASFSTGTDLGGGEWSFTPGELSALTFSPPLATTGTYTFTVKAIATAAASGVTTATATESTSFTVDILPLLGPGGAFGAPGGPGGGQPGGGPPGSGPGPGPGGGPGPVAGSGGGGDGGARPGGALSEVRTMSVFSSSSTATGPSARTETNVSNAPPAPGSLFAPVAVPLPSYGAGERHPLPPVLPLDQTLPVAGFTESGGDSFALVDILYREAAMPAQPAGAISLAPPDENTPELPVTSLSQNVTRILLGTDSENAEEVPTHQLGEEPGTAGEASWRVWAAAGTIAGSLAVWVWVPREVIGLPVRLVRRMLRALRPTLRTT